MPDILHDLVIARPPEDVYRAIALPSGLDRWWTRSSAGRAEVGAEFQFGFGPGYDWTAMVIEAVPDRRLVWRMAVALPDWVGTVIGFSLEPVGRGTRVRFRHEGWAEADDHYRISSYCWAMYLRLLARLVEHGEVVPYEDRLSA